MSKLHREPSIHITSTNLSKVLKKVLGSIKDEQVNYILLEARKYQLSNRKLLSNNEKAAQKINIIKRSSLENATIMAQAIYFHRKKLKHRGIEVIMPGNKDFAMVKTITKNAIEFHESFNKDTHELGVSFNLYIEKALKLIEKFSLPKLQYIHQTLISHEEANIEIAKDANRLQTESAYTYYTQHVIKQVGSLLVDYKKDPTKYKYFVLVSQECKRLKIKPQDYIQAQFDGLAWNNGIPNPEQLVGEKAAERLQKYLFQNQIQVGDTKQTNEGNINRLKGLRKLK